MENKLIPVPFYESMQRSKLFDVEYAKKDKDWQLLKKLYDDNYLGKVGKKLGGYKIPKIIHQIWIGGKEYPERYREYGETWIKHHPGWKYKLWTDKDALDFPMINREIFDRVENIGAKADIFRLEILYKYGGVYVDTDFECVSAIDNICRISNFFTGLAYSRNVEFYNGLIGVCRSNEYVRSYIDKIHKNFINNNFVLKTNDVMINTGPYCFTNTLLDSIKKNNNNGIIFPVTFFYSFPNYERENGNNKLIVNSYVRPESTAIHYWSTTWVDKTSILDRLFVVMYYIKHIIVRKL